MGLSRRRFLELVGIAGLTAAAAGPLALAEPAFAVRRRPREVWINAPTDGTDVTQTILAQIAAARDGSVIRFRPGRYRCEGSLLIRNRTGLTFRGPATFYATAPGPLDAQGMSQRRHWWFQGSRSIALQDIRVESTNTRHETWDTGGREGFGCYLAKYEFEHAFAFHECAGVQVTACSTYGTWGDGLYIGNQAPSTDVVVNGLTVEYNGRQGLAISNADRVRLSNIRILNTRRAGFDLEPAISSWHVRNVEISNSYVRGFQVAFAAGGEGDVSDIRLHHNTVVGPGVPWVYVVASDGTRRGRWTVEDNVVTDGLGSPVAALRFVNVNDVHVRRNVSPIALSQSRLAITFQDCQGQLEVANNDFRDANVLSQSIGDCSPIEASGNLITVP